jgi:L-threonylcarbamoyladenylate synthase
VLLQGGIIAYPTESVFGLGCDPDNGVALRRLIDIKKRSEKKGMLIVCHDFDLVKRYINQNLVDEEELKFAFSCWEGFCTLAVPASEAVHPLLRGDFPTVAVRISRHPAVAEICGRFKKPVVSTSANLSGREPLRTYADTESVFGRTADFILDGQTLGYERPSRIIDLRTRKILRD